VSTPADRQAIYDAQQAWAASKQAPEGNPGQAPVHQAEMTAAHVGSPTIHEQAMTHGISPLSFPPGGLPAVDNGTPIGTVVG